MDPQLIKELTGDKSDALMLHKKLNINMKEEISSMLNVLPVEIQSVPAQLKMHHDGS